MTHGNEKDTGKSRLRRGTTDEPHPQRVNAQQSDASGLFEEWLYLAEELALTKVATDMVRGHKRLMRMHYRIEDTLPRPRRRTGVSQARIPSSIDGDDLKNRLMIKFAVDQVYLRDDLTLASLAHELEIEPHHLSRFLNIHLKTTFSTLVNTYRVKEARTLLAGSRRESILDIAFASGFNSKASFNRIFKKVTGFTPQQYRQSVRGA